MKKIIALKGRGGSGKSTTIKILPNILLKNGYGQVPGKFKQHGFDILDIFEKSGVKVGITSSGDTFDLVSKRLDELTKAGCEICICACRTSDRKPPGTIAATQSYPNYKAFYMDKTYASDQTTQAKVNNSDANKLFRII